MLAIRQFADERKAWEDERDLLEQRERDLTCEKQQVEEQLQVLAQEVDRLRHQASSAPAVPVTPRGGRCDQVRSHHEQQLALMSKIDALRNDLYQEQSKSRLLERRATEAERTNKRLSAEIDRQATDLDTTMGSRRGTPDLDTTMGSRRTPKANSSCGSNGENLNDELSETVRSLETSRKEVFSLEDEMLRLREELNNEKQKVIELKKAAHSRSAAWKEELQKITEELSTKQRLEEEVAHLRLDQSRFRKERDMLTEREVNARREAERMQRELVEARADRKDARSQVAEKVEEMEILSNVVGGQLVAVEQELTQQMKKSSQLLERFLRHVHEPVATVRRSLRDMAKSGAAGNEMISRPVPPIFEANVHELGGNLGKIVDILRFAAEVLQAWVRRQQNREGAGVYDRLEEGKEYAKSFMKPFLA